MAVQHSIAIIGATGTMGSAITRALAGNDHELLLMARDQQKIKKLTGEINNEYPLAGVIPVNCSIDACWEADIIILAVPAETLAALSIKIKEVVTQKIVISASKETSIEQLQMFFPHSKTVRAFYSNTPGELHAVKPGHKINSFIMSDDKDALETVSALLIRSGLKPVEQSINVNSEFA